MDVSEGAPYTVSSAPVRKGAGEKLTQAAKAYVEAHSAEKFSLQAVASALYVNGSYLLRTFKAHTGYTLLRYHNFVRCEKAKALLACPEKSISQMNQDLRMVEPKQRESFIAKNQKQNEDCLDLSMNIYENRKDFKRMFDEAKDWKSLVDLSKKALTTSGLEITFKLREVGNKIAEEDSIAEKQQNQLNKQNQKNKDVKPKSIK